MKKLNSSWGHNVKTYPNIYSPENKTDILKIINKSNANLLKGYRLFKKNISYFNKKKKIQSIFSKRLGL